METSFLFVETGIGKPLKSRYNKEECKTKSKG
jgi:hypothetical protein